MKKIKILIMIFLFADAASMYGMTTVKTARRLPTAGKILLQKPIQQKQPTQPQPIQPSSPSLQLETGTTSPFLNQKKLLNSAAFTAAKAKIAQAGQYVRNWFNNLMTSWFGPSSFAEAMADRQVATESTIAQEPLQEPLIVFGSSTPSPFTGIQKRQYSAAADVQPSIPAEKKLSAQEESDAIIRQLESYRSFNKL